MPDEIAVPARLPVAYWDRTPDWTPYYYKRLLQSRRLPLSRTFYLDAEGGSDANDGTTFPNRWKTITSGATAARIAPGDVIRIMASKDIQSLGINGTWTNKSKTVTLASALTGTVTLCDSVWTASASVTATASATRKEGTNSASLAIAAGFTTGLVAYFAIASTDFSAYKQISFWMRADVAVASGVFELRLCSDAAGVTAVDTFAIPAFNAAGYWVACTIDKAAALGAAIQSVALYAVTDPGTVTVLLDDIVACKDSTGADALSLTSLIGKNTAGETFWPIQSINGVTVLLDGGPNADAGTTIPGYSGVSETVAAYKREPIYLSTATSELLQDLGTDARPIIFSGGWDRTIMETQSGQSWWLQPRSTMATLDTNTQDYVKIERMGFVRSKNFPALYIFGTCRHVELDTISCNGNEDGMEISATGEETNVILSGECFFHANGHSTAIGDGYSDAGAGVDPSYTLQRQGGKIYCHGNTRYGMNLNGNAGRFEEIACNNNGISGLAHFGTNTIKRLTCKDNTNYALETWLSSRLVILESFITSGNGGGFFVLSMQNASQAWSHNCSHAEAPSDMAYFYPGTFGAQRYMAERYGGVADDHRIFTPLGKIVSHSGADRHTASGIAWKLSPVDADLSADRSLSLLLAKIAVAANALVTVKAWMKRDSTSLTGRLFCRGGQLNGVSSDVSASVTAGAGTYEELTITFTPTEAGVIEIEAQAYGGTTLNLWVDDMTISQA